MASMMRCDRLLVRPEARREAALVADRRREALFLQVRLERVEDLGARAQRLGEASARRAGTIMNSWISRPLSACAPPLRMFISGVGSDARVRAAEVAPERQLDRVGRGARDRHRDAEDRVRAELRLVRRAVSLRSAR